MARVWITDGSVPGFSDTERLKASHKGMLGLPVRYEGFVDPDVPRGSATVRGGAEDVLYVEAEWVVEFPEGIPAPGAVIDSTPIVLQGLIEGKWMNRLLGTRAWQPASIGNNVLGEGPGMATTLGALESALGGGETRIDYALADGTPRVHRTSASNLSGENIPDLIRDVLRVGIDLDAIDLGAVGPEAAVVNEPQRMRASIRHERLPIPDPRPHAAKERLVRRAIADGLGLPPGGTAIVSTAVEGAAEKLERAGIRAAVRAGALRASFHLYSTEADVDAALDALVG
jgi:hypothetical protein